MYQIAATVAYWIIFRLLALYPYIEMLRACSAVIAAFAVSGMHFTGMAAAKYVIIDGTKNNVSRVNVRHTISSNDAKTGALVASAILLFGITILSIADLRAWFYNQSNTLHQIELMIKQIEKSPDFSAANGNLLLKYRTIIEKNSQSSSHNNSRRPSQSIRLIPLYDYFFGGEQVHCQEQVSCKRIVVEQGLM
jgi:hypothetical protein